jgi:hypothetical protein
MIPAPRLSESCPTFRRWLDECDLLLRQGNDKAAEHAWNQAVSAARAYRKSLETARVG